MSDSAFPHIAPVCEAGGLIGKQFVAGLTKREYFAAKAMQGILANATIAKTILEKNMYGESPAMFAKAARENADALIADLAKPRVSHEP